jgi:hypothetical protein
MFRTLYFALAWPFFPIFYKRTMPYNKKTCWRQPFGQYGKIFNLGLAVLTSLSLGQYSKTSVGYFPVLPSLSVSKLLAIRVSKMPSIIFKLAYIVFEGY